MTTHALIVVDAADALARTVSGWKSVRRTPMLQVQTDDLPSLAVYLLREQMAPEGDANAGEPRFIHDVSIGLSGAIMITDGDAQLLALDTLMSALCTKLLSSTTFVALIEGVNGIDRRLSFTKDSETPMAEIQIEMRVGFRSNWPPLVTDDLETIHVTSALHPGDTQEEIDSRIQVVREYDVSQT